MKIPNELLIYKKKGYRIVDSRAMGILKGLSKDNCIYEDIKTVILKQEKKFM